MPTAEAKGNIARAVDDLNGETARLRPVGDRWNDGSSGGSQARPRRD